MSRTLDIPTLNVKRNVEHSDPSSLLTLHDVGMVTRSPLGDRIRALREAKKLKQAAAAEAIGIARSYLSSIETGGDLPGRETLAAIAKFYDVPPGYLYSALPSASPGGCEIVDDPDELAFLGFWRILTVEERSIMLRMLRATTGQRGRAA
jgi:transcriptional regulator with XRE-family HTH domain